MKRHRIDIIRSFFKMTGWCVALSLGACTDEEWDNGDVWTDGDAVCFNVTSGITSGLVSRAQSDAAEDAMELLQPLVLKSPELEQSLYLHTYVAQESERATGSTDETRAAQVNNINDFFTLNGEEGFEVTARYTDNQEEFIPAYAAARPLAVQTGKDIWSTAPVYYWPNNERMLCFSAYAPKSAKGMLKDMTIADTKIDFDYTVPVSENKEQDAERQPDIMFAVTECNKKTSADNKVPLNFRHALSAIKFAVRDVVGGRIGKITVSGVAGTGHCTYTGQSGSGGDVFAWTQLGTTDCTYSQMFNYQTADNYIPDPPGYDKSQDVILNAAMPEKTFMLIPQDIPADATITIEFIRDTDGQLFTLTGKINDNKVTKWEPGKEYIYTISTSSSNWTYIFEVTGCNQAINDDEPDKGAFNDAPGQITVNQTVVDGAYYKVKSYRERANNLKDKEPVAWSAVTSDGSTIIPADLKGFIGQNIQDLVIGPDVWIPRKTMDGNGSAEFIKYDVTFYPQMVGTSWKGDWDMREKEGKGSSASPVDLSNVNGRVNTANCYVVNAPGYYKFPLVYGNAITDGVTNTRSYTYSNTTTFNKISRYPALSTFVDYLGKNITTPYISGAASAVLVWQDAYNLISDVKLNVSEKTLSFKVNRENLQQGNAVLAIRDSQGRIMWSWHIWITEHWINDSLQLGTGDVACDAWDSGYSGFTVAPYNLGWCDPKDVWYLKRAGKMTFTQKASGKEIALDVVQREHKIEYWIGNNVYYQFGRKDPIVGFMNSNSVVKYNFGELPYQLEPQTKTLAYGIQHPNILFVGGASSSGANDYETADWVSPSYHNLWNNTNTALVNVAPTTLHPYFYSGEKTVYDPSPAGYQVPPVNFFKIITAGRSTDSGNSLVFNGNYEGMTEHSGYYVYTAYSKKNKTGQTMTFTGTGHRWYTTTPIGAGENFNPTIVYLWSNQIYLNIDNRAAAGLALGGDGNTSNYCFVGRRSMARPVRPVKLFHR